MYSGNRARGESRVSANTLGAENIEAFASFSYATRSKIGDEGKYPVRVQQSVERVSSSELAQKNVSPGDREYGRRRCRRLHENEGKNLFRPRKKRRVSGMIYARTGRGKVQHEISFLNAVRPPSSTREDQASSECRPSDCVLH